MYVCLSGLSVDRPCARSVKVDCPCVFSQVCVRGGVVWALSEHKALFYREGLNSFCSEGEGWKYDTVRYCNYQITSTLLQYCHYTTAIQPPHYCSVEILLPHCRNTTKYCYNTIAVILKYYCATCILLEYCCSTLDVPQGGTTEVLLVLAQTR